MSELEKEVLKYGSSDVARFHMPGHKGRKPGGILPDELYAYDITELSFSDELFEAEGAIEEAEVQLSRLFGSGATLLSPFGATSCIQTMVDIAVSRGRIALPRNMHYSVFNAVGRSSGSEVLLDVTESEKTPAGMLLPATVEEAFRKDGEIAALFVTSVDYYGAIADIKAYAALCKKYCKLLLVDNSHGAHLRFTDGFEHPIDLGADMVCDSLHKTVPAMTGSALLHFSDSTLAPEGKKRMKRICSSSPSYPIMLSVCAAASWLREYGRTAYTELSSRASLLRSRLKDHGYSVGSGEPCRLYVCGERMGLSGGDISDALAQRGCVPEFSDDCGVLLMLSPMNTELDIERLEAALLSLSKKNITLQKEKCCDIIPQRALGISEAMHRPCEAVPPERAIGRIAAECIGRYPPGLPQIIIGEYIGSLPRGINMKNILVVAE